MTDSVDLDRSSTHSLNYGSDFKEIHCSQQQSVSKLSRNDLEDLYYQLHDENIQIKKKFNNLDSKYKIMATRVMRLSRDHKCPDSIDREEDQRQIHQLKQNEAALRAKVTVLRGQLASHTRLHSAALSKMQRPRPHRCSRICHTGHSSCAGDDELPFDTCRTGSQSRLQSRHRSSSRSGSHIVGIPTDSKDHTELAKTNSALQEEVANLQERICVLQKDMQLASEQSRSRILQLEAELGKHITQETAENVELIRARRANKQQEAVIISVQQESQAVQRELHACKAALALATRDQDEMCSNLMRERQKNTDLQQEVVKLTHSCSSMREIQEQLNDLKKENAVLKEHSNRLLQLTTGMSGVTCRNRDNPDPNKNPAVPYNHDQQSANVEEKTAAEESLESLQQQQSFLTQQVKEAQNEISVLQGKIQKANEERRSLIDEYEKIQNECSSLVKDLARSKEEKKMLAQQVEEVSSECARLSEELSKGKFDFQHQQQQQQQQQQLHSLFQGAQERRATERLGVNERAYVTPSSPEVIQSNQTFSYTPQISSRPSLYPSTLLPHSLPSTPRPRVGDACLALLEQTAIRPPSSSFPGVLGSHSSLQEKFLELCKPNDSISTPSTPMPSVSLDETRSPIKMSSTTLPVSEETLPGLEISCDTSATPRGTQRSQPAAAQSDTLWELEKCRELLRRQFNLNSIYKKEVDSLNNIVQSLTSGAQSRSK